jgi:hypothetical protein
MALTLPPAVNYQSPLIPIPAKWGSVPPEGPQMVPCEIDWGTTDKGLGAVSMNVQNNQTANFSQIVAISCDNSNCGADVTFIFTDTQEEYTVPAHSPASVFPVFTNQTQFFVVASGALPGDITRFSLHNVMPPPSSITEPAVMSVASASNMSFDGVTNYTLLSSGNGSLQAFSLRCSIQTVSNAFHTTLKFQDGAANVLFTCTVDAPAGANVIQELANISNVNLRFKNGLVLAQSGGTNAGGILSLNAYYRLP